MVRRRVCLAVAVGFALLAAQDGRECSVENWTKCLGKWDEDGAALFYPGDLNVYHKAFAYADFNEDVEKCEGWAEQWQEVADSGTSIFASAKVSHDSHDRGDYGGTPPGGWFLVALASWPEEKKPYRYGQYFPVEDDFHIIVANAEEKGRWWMILQHEAAHHARYTEEEARRLDDCGKRNHDAEEEDSLDLDDDDLDDDGDNGGGGDDTGEGTTGGGGGGGDGGHGGGGDSEIWECETIVRCESSNGPCSPECPGINCWTEEKCTRLR